VVNQRFSSRKVPPLFGVVDLPSFDPLSNNLLNVLDARDLRSLLGAKILRVLFITWRLDLARLRLLSVWAVHAVKGGDGGAGSLPLNS